MKRPAEELSAGAGPVVVSGSVEQPVAAGSAVAGSGRRGNAAIRAALLRFRVVAYLVGVGLIVLVLVGMPLKYLADSPGVVETVSPVHGFLFMVYLGLTLDLASRCRFPARRTLMVMLAGTIPFLSFVAERSITHGLTQHDLTRRGERGPVD